MNRILEERRRRHDLTHGRAAIVIILPIVPRRSFHDPAWREQYERECWAQVHNDSSPPPRTRPLVVVQRPEQER